MKLTADQIDTLTSPSSGQRKVFDGNGLYLLLSHTGARGWRLKYRHAGREQLLSLGAYPAVGLSQARQAAAAARELLRQGINPSDARKRENAARKDAARPATRCITSGNPPGCYQTTVPGPVRAALKLSRHDKVHYKITPGAVVMTRAAEPEKDDPVLNKFLAFMANDIATHPERLRAIDKGLYGRIRSLVGHIDVDLNEPLSPAC